MSRVLVTGATGFIGAHLVQQLAAEGAHIAAFQVEDSETLRRLESFRQVEADWRQVDLRTFGAVANAVKTLQPDLVFHLAAAGVTDPFLSPDAAIRTNVYGTIHLLRAVGGRAPVIVARTPGERDALNVYAASKAAAWNFCEMYRQVYGWPIVGAMVFQAYGPGQTMKAVVPSAIAAALRGDDFPMTPGGQQRDWVYIDDVVDALMRIGRRLIETPAATGALPTLEIGTGQAVSVRTVVQTIYHTAGGSGQPLVGALPARPGEVGHQAADVERTAQSIGWRAQVALADGLRKTIEWTRERLTRPAN